MGNPKKLGCAIFTLLGLLLAEAVLAAAQDRVQHADQTSVQISSDRVLFPPAAEATQRPIPPQKIKIGEVVYTVKLVKDPPAWGEYGIRFSGKTCDHRPPKEGGCDVQDHIYIEADQTLIEEQNILWHELHHAVLGIDLSDQQATYHQFIYKLSPKLLQVLQDNPELYLYLTASESNVTTATK